MSIILAILEFLLSDSLKDVVLPMAEDAATGRLAPPPATVSTGFVDPDLEQQVINQLNNP